MNSHLDWHVERINGSDLADPLTLRAEQRASDAAIAHQAVDRNAGDYAKDGEKYVTHGMTRITP